MRRISDIKESFIIKVNLDVRKRERLTTMEDFLELRLIKGIIKKID
jgi:hypothetical protein